MKSSTWSVFTFLHLEVVWWYLGCFSSREIETAPFKTSSKAEWLAVKGKEHKKWRIFMVSYGICNNYSEIWILGCFVLEGNFAEWIFKIVTRWKKTKAKALDLFFLKLNWILLFQSGLPEKAQVLSGVALMVKQTAVHIEISCALEWWYQHLNCH